jgi:hypothetical protein
MFPRGVRALFVAGLVGLAVLGLVEGPADAPRPLFKAPPDVGYVDPKVILGESGIRGRLAVVDLTALPAPPPGAGQPGVSTRGEVPETKVELNLFPEDRMKDVVRRTAGGGVKGPPAEGPVVVTGVLKRFERAGKETVTWLGRVEGRPYSTVAVTAHRGVVGASIASPGLGTFVVKPLPGKPGVSIVRQVDPGRIPECVNRAQVGRKRDARPGKGADKPAPAPAPAGGPEDGTRIDVMALYTTDAKTAEGGDVAVETLIHSAVARGNQALLNSRVDTVFNLVHLEEAAGYAEKPGGDGFDTMLAELTDPADGQLDGVHALRDTYRADLVFLVVANTALSGSANTMETASPEFESQAFSVTSREYAYDWISAAHEMAHNMGCGHDPGDSQSVGPYAHGLKFTAGGHDYRTVMSVRSGDRIEYFSNPSLSFLGVATGVANSADNARALNQTRGIVANFRQAP